mmetsp:Transcript_18807/g.56387  ORF Transcript_18807/g.56387 Transcript_18807/m.56387 type:complete len:568 (-) Transcript_18807:234-1937(-)
MTRRCSSGSVSVCPGSPTSNCPARCFVAIFPSPRPSGLIRPRSKRPTRRALDMFFRFACFVRDRSRLSMCVFSSSSSSSLLLLLQMLVPLLLATLLVAFYWLFSPQSSTLPGPAPRWMLGNLLDFDFAESWVSFAKLAQTYGRTYRLKLGFLRGSGNTVLTSDPEMLKELFTKHFKKTCRGATFQLIEPFFGAESFFLKDGPEWENRRKFFHRLVSFDHLKKMVPKMHASIHRMCSVLDEAAETPLKPVDMKVLCQRLAFDLNCALSFGYYDENTITGDGELDHVFDVIWEHFTWRALFGRVPYWKWIRTPAVRAFDHAMSLLEAKMAHIIKSREQQKELNDSQTDFLSAMIRYNRTNPADPFGPKEIRDQVFTFLNGGTDTSSSTFIWMTILLSQHPHVMRRVRKEVQTVLGDRRELTYEDIGKLTYCSYVVKETWRLFPPATAASRMAIEDIVLKDFVIPKGWEVWASIYALHRDPEIYENPDTFHPDRWETLKVSSYEYFVFSGPPRLCLGNQIAIMEAVGVLALVLARYDFCVTPTKPGAIRPGKGVLLHPHESVLMNVFPLH